VASAVVLTLRRCLRPERRATRAAIQLPHVLPGRHRCGGRSNLNADSAFQIFECIFEVAEQALIGGHIPDLKFQHHIRPTARAVTSNLHPSGFDSIMPKTLATATADRLLHHAHLVATNGTQNCS
jgi:hypothetical protein